MDNNKKILYIPDGTTQVTYHMLDDYRETLEEVYFPSSVEYLGCDTFWNCKNLKKVQLNEGLEEIDADAFTGCSKLEEIAMPSTLKIIRVSAFWNCENLKSVELNEGLESIGDFAFSKCSSLQELTIPSTVKELGEEIANKNVILKRN